MSAASISQGRAPRGVSASQRTASAGVIDSVRDSSTSPPRFTVRRMSWNSPVTFRPIFTRPSATSMAMAAASVAFLTAPMPWIGYQYCSAVLYS